MRSAQNIKLPSAEPAYSVDNERVMRRTAEQALEDLRNDIITARNKSDSSSSLALRRFQFLLMGA